jgi:hypothetical protein
MEESMLGERRNLRFWRPRPARLARERALTTSTRIEGRTEAERTVIAQQIEQRRFEQAKGRIRPGT